jgi:hypothetical protein
VTRSGAVRVGAYEFTHHDKLYRNSFMPKKRPSSIARPLTCLVLVALGLAACDSSKNPPQDTVRAQPGNPADMTAGVSYGLKLIQGTGFVLSIPNDAIVDRRVDSTGNPRWTVQAPSQRITAGLGTADTTRFTDDRPLYSLNISVGHKPVAQSLKAWGDSVVASHEAAADEQDKGETGTLVTVAGASAYLREPPCGDCGVYIFTFANGERLVVIQYTMDTAEPLAVRKHGIYALILSTFRWSTSRAR